MAFNFPAPAWVHTTNIYEINLRQYSDEGTLNAFIKDLPRLKTMGVKTLWFMPLTPISKKNRKGSLGSYYACSDYSSISDEFGNIEDFKNLVDLAHSSGMKVVIDWVANHTGWDHVWTSSHPEYYKKDPVTRDFLTASGMDDIIELDFANEKLRNAMIDAMSYWVTEFDIDGFRCDLAFWVELSFWKEAREKLDKIKPLFWLGEFDELEHSSYGEVFDASYSWTWMHATRKFYQEEKNLTTLVSILKDYDDLGDATIRTWFTSNHDENSWNGTEFEKYGGMADLLSVFSFTWNGIPLLYNGQEIPNRKRLAFFEKDPLEWRNDQDSKEEFYKILYKLRDSHTALRAGDHTINTFRIKANHAAQVFSYLRRSVDGEVLVILNFSENPLEVEFLDKELKGTFTNAFTGKKNDFSIAPVADISSWGYLVFFK